MPTNRRQTLAFQTLGLLIALLVCFTVAGLGVMATTPKIPGWYADLAKPDWTPPDWVFGPVWTLLYAMMAVAVWLVWRREKLEESKASLTLFAGQLVLNCFWSFLFFGLESPGFASVNIVLLWGAILATLLSFWRRSKWAGMLLIPYLLWVSYATALNIAIWQMNS